jgi:hypothetical protein
MAYEGDHREPVYLTFGALDRFPSDCPFRRDRQPRRETMSAEATAMGWETCCLIPLPDTLNMTSMKSSLRRLYGLRDEIDSYKEGNTTWLLNNKYRIELGGHWAVLGLTDSDAVKLKMLW